MVKKKKNTRNHKTFSEVVGLKAFFQNDIINFIVGILLVLLAIYTINAYVSFFSTGQNCPGIACFFTPFVSIVLYFLA